MTERKNAGTPEILRPDFGQHAVAIDELTKLLAQTTQWRDTMQKQVSELQRRLHDDERRLTDYNCRIASFRNAIRVLGGKVPDQPFSPGDMAS